MNEPISHRAISPLRQRLIDDMNMRRFSRETQRNYLRDVGRFATFLGRSPDTATADDLRRFQIEQQEAGVPAPTMNSIVSALRFFFTHTIDRPDLARKLVRVAHPRNLPVVLSRDEVARLLNATTCLKHQAALSVAYGAGLRVAEVSALKVSRYRQRAHAAPGRAWQGRPVSQCHAPGRSAHPAARVVEGRAPTGRDASRRLAVSGTARDEADQHPATPSHRRRGGAGRGDRQAGRTAHAAPQLRHPSAGGRHRHPGHPGPARARQAGQHRPLHEGRHPNGAHRYEPQGNRIWNPLDRRVEACPARS